MAFNSSTINPMIPIFKGEGYDFWSKKMKTLLSHKIKRLRAKNRDGIIAGVGTDATEGRRCLDDGAKAVESSVNCAGAFGQTQRQSLGKKLGQGTVEPTLDDAPRAGTMLSGLGVVHGRNRGRDGSKRIKEPEAAMEAARGRLGGSLGPRRSKEPGTATEEAEGQDRASRGPPRRKPPREGPPWEAGTRQRSRGYGVETESLLHPFMMLDRGIHDSGEGCERSWKSRPSSPRTGTAQHPKGDPKQGARTREAAGSRGRSRWRPKLEEKVGCQPP